MKFNAMYFNHFRTFLVSAILILVYVSAKPISKTLAPKADSITWLTLEQAEEACETQGLNSRI